MNIYLFIASLLGPPENPCNPSPCGANSQCQVINSAPACSCLPEFRGSPPNCKPECSNNNDCPHEFACINKKCRDPCPGSCGALAECCVVSHTPTCTCPPGYTGDPFTSCQPQSSKSFKYVRNSLLLAKYYVEYSLLRSRTIFNGK